MNAIESGPSHPEEQLKPSPPLLRAVVACDLVESTALTEELGDRGTADVIHLLDRQARDLLRVHGGQEIDKTDGFLLLFERPIKAVAFALDYQRLLRGLSEERFLPLKARIGIHVGDVVLWRNSAEDIARGAKPVEVEGLVKPLAARLMSLALPGQILLSGVAHALALRATDELPEERVLQWRTYGRYRFKGVADPIDVFEVGESGVAPFSMPTHSGKAQRERPWWRRPGMLVVEAALLLAAIAIPAYLSLRSPSAIAFGERDWVVVGDLNNQTGESILNDSLQTAFRIGLEQSRYVNVLSDLKVRDTLALMQRDPEKTRIDRAVGSEVAVRNGARALILPTVAEIGGHVRVTVEVIDPSNQTTVYSETSEGAGYNSLLPSLDQVNQRLRISLGEALSMVQANNVPLPQVTTSNLDALRAYALGIQALAHGHPADALELFEHAVKLDPDFALAYIGMLRVYVGNNDDASALRNAEKAASLKERLPARDRLYLDAWLARFGPPSPMLDKWRLLGKMYPDYYAAHYNYAFFAWHLENRAADAITAIQPALSEHDPLRGVAYYTLGYLEAANEMFDPALKSFREAAALGDSEQGQYHAATYAAQRRFSDAMRLLDSAKPSGLATTDIFLRQMLIAIHVDRGEWAQARDVASIAAKEADKAGALYGRAFRAGKLSLEDYWAADNSYREELHKFVDSASEAMQQHSLTNHDDNIFSVLFGAYLAIRAGEQALARDAIESAAPQAKGSGFPNLEHMLVIVQAEQMRVEGHADQASRLLEASIDGTELYLTHAALADAYIAAGQSDKAIGEARWLLEHRGRAYLEWNSFQLLQTRNIIESNIAYLRMAEADHALGKDEDARKQMASFAAIWHTAALPARIASRAAKVRVN